MDDRTLKQWASRIRETIKRDLAFGTERRTFWVYDVYKTPDRPMPNDYPHIFANVLAEVLTEFDLHVTDYAGRSPPKYVVRYTDSDDE